MKEQFSGHGIEEAVLERGLRPGGRSERNLNTAVSVPDWGQPLSPPHRITGRFALGRGQTARKPRSRLAGMMDDAPVNRGWRRDAKGTSGPAPRQPGGGVLPSPPRRRAEAGRGSGAVVRGGGWWPPSSPRATGRAGAAAGSSSTRSPWGPARLERRDREFLLILGSPQPSKGSLGARRGWPCQPPARCLSRGWSAWWIVSSP